LYFVVMRRALSIASALVCLAWGASAHAQPTPLEVGPDKPPDVKKGVLFDLNGAAPAVPGGGILLIGDGSIGYQWGHFGGLASGSFNAYGLISSSAIASSRRLIGDVALWGSIGSADTRFELRPTFGYAVYESERLSLDGDVAFFAERSLMVRFGNLVGVRHEPERRRFGVGAWVGAGGQVEGYASLYGNLETLTGKSAFAGTLTANVSGRLRGFVHFGELALGRVESDIQAFTITKDTATLDLDSALTGSADHSSAIQVDSVTRAYVDILAASFYGFVPLASVGLDVFYTASDGEPTATSVVPSAGLGLRHTRF
jgi:hypothetical protein